MQKKIRRIITDYTCTCAGGETITMYEQPGLKEIKENGIISIQPETVCYEMPIETFVKIAKKEEN